MPLPVTLTSLLSIAGSVVADDAAEDLVSTAGVCEVVPLVHRDVAGVGAAAELTGALYNELRLVARDDVTGEGVHTRQGQSAAASVPDIK